MTQVYAIDCGLPFCQKPEKQTNTSIGIRVTAIVLGIIAAVIGTLILFNITDLNRFGTTVGWITASIGTFLVLFGSSIRCIKNSQRQKKPESISEKEPKYNSKGAEVDSILIPTVVIQGNSQIDNKTEKLNLKNKKKKSHDRTIIQPDTRLAKETQAIEFKSLEEEKEKIAQELKTQAQHSPKSLEEAIKRGLFESVVEFIVNGADIRKIKDDDGDEITALHLAAQYDKDGKIIEKLIESGLDVNTPVEHHDPSYGEVTGSRLTPLHYAVFFNGSKITQLLIDKGANIHAKDECLRTALHCVCRSTRLDIEEQIKIIDYLKGVDINAQDCHGTTPIHEACTSGRMEIFDKLLKMGADVNICNEQEFNSIAYAASKKGNIILIKRLINEFKLDPHKKSKHNQRAVDFVPKDWSDVIALLTG